jgi:hypothetical protein
MDPATVVVLLRCVCSLAYRRREAHAAQRRLMQCSGLGRLSLCHAIKSTTHNRHKTQNKQFEINLEINKLTILHL